LSKETDNLINILNNKVKESHNENNLNEKEFTTDWKFLQNFDNYATRKENNSISNENENVKDLQIKTKSLNLIRNKSSENQNRMNESKSSSKLKRALE
jgi:hypothetical protein